LPDRLATLAVRIVFAVHPFPNAEGGKWKISNTGGTEPRWRPDGKELSYRSSEGEIVAASINSAGEQFQLIRTTTLFRPPISTKARNYDVTADGQRFLIDAVPEGQSVSRSMMILLNWPALKKSPAIELHT
jgi:hypothetical protein